MRMNNKLLSATGLIVMAIFLIAGSALAGSSMIKWKAQYGWHKGDATRTYGWEPTLEKIQKLSKGRIEIDFYEPNALVPNKGMLGAVSKKAIDLAMGGASRYAIIPENLGKISQGIPMAWSNPEDAYKIFFEHGLLELLQEMYAEKFNVKYFPAGGSGQYGISTGFPFKSLADFKGKKMRASSTYAGVIESLGATAAYIPGAELYMGLKLGTVDGMVYSYNGFVTQKFGEVLSHVMLPALVTPPAAVYWFNLDSWNALPKDLQVSIANQIKEDFLPSTRTSMEQDAKAIKDSGMTAVQLSPEETKAFRKMCMKSWDETAKKGPTAKKAIEILKNYYKM